MVYRCGGAAVKVLREELRSDPEVRERFGNDATVASLVEHPNVVRVLEAGAGWVRMELVEGPSLRELAPLPVARAAALVVQAASAVDAVHAAGYVHRDVKPGNLLVGPADRVVLIDFALARRMDAPEPWVTAEGNWLGTPEFAAPEQIRGLAMDARSEVYSLGAVLYWAITGEVPFARGDADAIMRAHLHDPPPGTGTPLDPVIARAMAKDPADRHPSAAAFSANVQNTTP